MTSAFGPPVTISPGEHVITAEGEVMRFEQDGEDLVMQPTGVRIDVLGALQKWSETSPYARAAADAADVLDQLSPRSKGGIASAPGTLTAVDFEVQYDPEHRYSFTETEDGTCITYGHVDREQFAAEVTAYDRHASGDAEAETTEPADVFHGYDVHLNPEAERDEWKISGGNVPPETPGAFPVTYVVR